MTATQPAVSGDQYIRTLAAYIKANEYRLVDGTTSRQDKTPLQYLSALNPISWVSDPPPPQLNTKASSSSLAARLRSQAGLSYRPPASPNRKTTSTVVLTLDPQHLLYLLTRFDELGIDVGPLDLRLDLANKPPTYVSFLAAKDPVDTASVNSVTSLRSISSAMSNLSMFSGWSSWNQQNKSGPSAAAIVDMEAKYTYSAFTKIPGLKLAQHTTNSILNKPVQGFEEFPLDTVLSLVPFKNLSHLELSNLSIRMFYGWDVLSDHLVSLVARNAGIGDVAELFIETVVDDMARRRNAATTKIFDDDADYGIDQLRSTNTNSPRSGGFLSPASPLTSPRPSRSRSRSSSFANPSIYDVDLPDGKWGRLRYLNLADNELTFISSESLSLLHSLSHLDLANNLLITIPPALSALPCLVSLNLANNMIETVMGIYATIPNIRVLNLSHNRLDNLCGLERLLTLERVDVRANQVIEAAEIGRLASLPRISNVWIDANPFVKLEPDYRVSVFNLFKSEGHDITIDGSTPTFNEQRQIVSKRPEEPAPPPIITASSSSHGGEAATLSVSPSAVKASTLGRKKGKAAAKRIVDLEAGDARNESASSPPKQHVHRLAELESQLSKVNASPPTMPVSPPTPRQRKTPTMIPNSEALVSSAAVPNPRFLKTEDSDGDAYKKRLEAIKAEAGSAWLRVLAGEMQQSQ